MYKSKKVIFSFAILALLVSGFTPFLPVAEAKADDLIIEDSGEVVLVITNNSVLAATTTSTTSSSAASTSPTPKPAATTPPQVVPVAPANSETKVKISPNTSTTTAGEKKIKITIETTKPSTPQAKTAPIPSQPAANTPSQATSAPSIPKPEQTNTSQITTTEKTVDNVILRDADKQPVVIIKPDEKQNNNLNIEQPSTGSNSPIPSVTTNLPVEIDAKSHKISVTTPDGGTKQLSVLPDQAVKGAEQIVNVNTSLPKSKEEVILTQDKGQAIYVVNETRKGKLLGIEIELPSQVKISAETGKKVSAWQSLPSLILGPFLR